MLKWHKHPTVAYWFARTAPMFKGGFHCRIYSFPSFYEAAITRNVINASFKPLEEKLFDNLDEAKAWCENRIETLS